MNWTTIIQSLIYCAAVSFGAIKGLQWYFENDRNKTDIKAKADIELVATKAKEVIEVKKAEVELARANALAATQVAEVLKNQHEFIYELEDMRKGLDTVKLSSEEKNAQLLGLINKIEEMVKQQTQNFTEFIMSRKS
jgi:hypothetical protein